MADSLWPDGLQHTRHLCPPPSPEVCPSSCLPSSHLILLCPLPLCPQSFPASGTFPVSYLFASNDQNTGVSASASVLPVIQGWFPLKLTGSISCWPRDSQESSLAPQFEDITSSDNRGRDGWVASLTHWTWVWTSSGTWWWTGNPGMLQFMGSQRVRHNWTTEQQLSSSHTIRAQGENHSLDYTDLCRPSQYLAWRNYKNSSNL